jgi:Uma2 family endonuclease
MKEIADRTYTVEEYFALAEESDVKLEYHYGRIYAMAGGNSNHSIIGTNIRRRLSEKLDDTDCVVYDSDMALSLEDGNRYVYPDGMVVCGPRDFSNAQQTRLKNPVLIIEVLSERTKTYDRTDKFRFYRSIPSLKEYLVISADKPLVENFYRQEEGLWRIGSAKGLEAEIHLFTFEIDIPLAQIYAKTESLQDPDQFL